MGDVRAEGVRFAERFPGVGPAQFLQEQGGRGAVQDEVVHGEQQQGVVRPVQHLHPRQRPPVQVEGGPGRHDGVVASCGHGTDGEGHGAVRAGPGQPGSGGGLDDAGAQHGVTARQFCHGRPQSLGVQVAGDVEGEWDDVLPPVGVALPGEPHGLLHGGQREFVPRRGPPGAAAVRLVVVGRVSHGTSSRRGS